MFKGIQFSSFGEFLHMGGYAFNVWTVYLLFAIFLAVNLAGPMISRRRLIKGLQRRARLAKDQQALSMAEDDESSYSD
jgi:heme exporter protein D